MKGTITGFEHLIFELFKEETHYDKTRHQLLRAYELMQKKVKKFKNFDLSTQYEICNTACLMAMGSSLRVLRTTEILTRNKPVNDIERDYSPEYGFVEPKKIELQQIKQLKQHDTL